ncbi:MAG TPA: heme ABC exporter ATP-binding protein CcmA [Rhizomicrobium sp.]
MTVILSFLETEKLTCIRGGRVVFRNLSFALKAGQTLAVEGANGSGKTSLLRMLAGFLSAETGRIRVNGAESDAEERGKFVGWLGHHDGAKPQLTPRETLTFFAGLHGAAGDVEAALAAVGLARAAGLPCQYLSAGQKRRLALARLKICARPLWLLDEPLAALDAQGKALLRAMIAAHCASGGIAIAATHEELGVDCTRLSLGAA